MNIKVSYILIITLINYYLTKGLFRYLGVIFLIFIASIIYLNDTSKNEVINKEKKDGVQLMIFVLPTLYYLIHSLFFSIFDNTYINMNMYIKEFIYVILPIIIIKIIDMIVQAEDRKIIDYLFYSVIASFIIQSFILNLSYIIENIGNRNRSFGLFENHILTQGLVYFFLYYIYIRDKKKVILSLIFIILGNKRVVYIGFIICIIPLLILKIKHISRTLKSILISIYLITIQLVYIFTIKFNILQEVFNRLGIDDKWRFAIWRSFFNDFNFGIHFSGNGVGYVYEKLKIIGNVWYPYLYNEPLKYIIELGIVGFILFSILKIIMIFYSKSVIEYRYFSFITLSICFSIGVVFMDNLNFYQEYLFLFYSVIYFSNKEYIQHQKYIS